MIDINFSKLVTVNPEGRGYKAMINGNHLLTATGATEAQAIATCVHVHFTALVDLALSRLFDLSDEEPVPATVEHRIYFGPRQVRYWNQVVPGRPYLMVRHSASTMVVFTNEIDSGHEMKAQYRTLHSRDLHEVHLFDLNLLPNEVGRWNGTNHLLRVNRRLSTDMVVRASSALRQTKRP